MADRIKRIDFELDKYIKGIGDRIYDQTGRRPSDVQISKIIPRMGPPPSTIIVIREPPVEPGRAGRRKRWELDIMRPY
jgi:hypothetical protein